MPQLVPHAHPQPFLLRSLSLAHSRAESAAPSAVVRVRVRVSALNRAPVARLSLGLSAPADQRTKRGLFVDLIVAISDLILVLIAAIKSVLGVFVVCLIVLPHYEAATMRFWGPNSAIRCFCISPFLS